MAKIRKIKLKYVKIFSNIICWFVLNVGSTESFAAPFSIRSLTCSAVNPSLYEGKRRITLSDDFCVLFFFLLRFVHLFFMWLPRSISFSGYLQTSPIQYRTDMKSVPLIKLAYTFHSCHIAKKERRQFYVVVLFLNYRKNLYAGKHS